MWKLQNAVLAAGLALAVNNPAHAATPAEDYIQTNVQHGLSILNDKSLSPDAERTQFRAFLESLTDIKRIALFTLGPAAAAAAPADVDAFVAAFHEYAVAEYEQQLSQYSGQTLKVTGSTERAAGDFIVDTVVTEPNGGGTEVDFRVRGDTGNFMVVDASVGGAWLAIAEREEFAGFLASHNNDVKALAAELQVRAASMHR